MKILALDSTAQTATVALTEDEKLLAEYTLNNGNTHSETLLPMVESMLTQLGMEVDDVELFALSCGPGSFTGVRIGAATVKGLAFGMHKPCIGVSTLEALAWNLVACPGLICPVMNARRSQVYTALFRSEGGTLTRLLPDDALSLAELEKILAGYNEPVRLCGDGYGIAREALKSVTIPETPDRWRHASAYSVAYAALAAYWRGGYTDDTGLKVTYLRPSQAERERLEAEKNKA